MFKLFIIINSLFMLLGSSFAIANELNIYSYRKPFLLKPFLDEYSKKTNIKFNVLHLKKGWLKDYFLREKIQKQI